MDDQKRTMTPSEAVAAGADYIVIGRPILKAKDRREAVSKIIEEIGLKMNEPQRTRRPPGKS
jgi:orotidine-5'-phosphate decarboxylase